MPTQTEKNQFNDICKGEFRKISDKLDTLHDKLFVGNGEPPITVQLDRLNGFKTKAYWFFCTIVVATVGVIARLVYTHIAE